MSLMECQQVDRRLDGERNLLILGRHHLQVHGDDLADDDAEHYELADQRLKPWPLHVVQTNTHGLECIPSKLHRVFAP